MREPEKPKERVSDLPTEEAVGKLFPRKVIETAKKVVKESENRGQGRKPKSDKK